MTYSVDARFIYILNYSELVITVVAHLINVEFGLILSPLIRAIRRGHICSSLLLCICLQSVGCLVCVSGGM
jgi:hypothetical protein